jgi:hypothetical protein
MEKASVNDTGCNWFALLEPHVVFNAVLKQFMVLLKGTLFTLKICINYVMTYMGRGGGVDLTSFLSALILDLLNSVRL